MAVSAMRYPGRRRRPRAESLRASFALSAARLLLRALGGAAVSRRRCRWSADVGLRAKPVDQRDLARDRDPRAPLPDQDRGSRDAGVALDRLAREQLNGCGGGVVRVRGPDGGIDLL